MEIITSKQNQLVKKAYALKEKAVRIKTNCFLVESVKIIEEAVKANYLIQTVFCTKQNCDKVEKMGYSPIIVNDVIIKHLCSTVTPQGVVAIVKKKVEHYNVTSRFLILDNIQNPDNMGAIFRCAAAFGFNSAYCLNCADCFNEKVIRSSMGNMFKIDIKNVTIEAIKKISKQFNLYCADMHGENISKVRSFEKDCGLVVGNEGNGVCDAVRDCCKKTLSIPMQNGVESLNVAVSAAILMHEMCGR